MLHPEHRSCRITNLTCISHFYQPQQKKWVIHVTRGKTMGSRCEITTLPKAKCLVGYTHQY